jgi:hypothetical protein
MVSIIYVSQWSRGMRRVVRRRTHAAGRPTPEVTGMTREPTARAVAGRGSRPWPWAEPVLAGFLVVDLLLFAGGAAAHAGLPIPLGFGTWVEPRLVPAAIVEGLGATGLAITLVGLAARLAWAGRLAWWVLWYCFAGVLWGMARLAMGSIPEARTVTNDFLHIAMTLVTTLALVRLASRRG